MLERRDTMAALQGITSEDLQVWFAGGFPSAVECFCCACCCLYPKWMTCIAAAGHHERLKCRRLTPGTLP